MDPEDLNELRQSARVRPSPDDQSAMRAFHWIILEWVMRAILSHASEITGVQPETPVEKTLVACDELAGFVTAASLVRPSKSVLDLEVASVIKRMKDKAFARQVPRDHLIRGAELMGLPLDQHVTNVIGFLRLQADALGLRGTL